MSEILHTKISVFPNTTSIEEVKGEINTIGSVLRGIKDGAWKSEVEKIRAGDKLLKKKVRTVAFHGLFDGVRKKAKFIEASGIIILDIDDIEDDLEEVKQEIMADSDHVVACMVSPSGNGIKVLYYVHPELVTQESYRQIGKELVADFDIYGSVDYLSVTDTLIVTYDPEILINYDAVPKYVLVKDFEVRATELEKRDESREIWEEADEFFETVLLNDVLQKTNNNFHFIQVSILDLAKFGFTHKEHDLEFIIDLSENEFGSSSKNKQRFDEVVALAENYPQLHWPYRITKEYEEEEAIDYSVYMEDSPELDTDSLEEDSLEGMIDYTNFKDKVIEVIKRGPRVGREISLENFANIYRFHGTGITLMTGIPSHGKTEFADQCVLDLARLYDEETLIVGFEQEPEEHVTKLVRKLVGKDIRCETWFINENMPILDKAINWVTSKIKHINSIGVGGDINKILEICAKQIKKSRDSGGNPRYVVIDPFNMLSVKGRYSGPEKVEEILRRILLFSHKMNVLVILIAHPTKMKKDEKTGEFEIPDFYSVKGSSAFYEMCYHGLVVYRGREKVLVKVLKVKQDNQGERDAIALFLYDRESGRYIPVNEELNELPGVHRDTDWLEKLGIN